MKRHRLMTKEHKPKNRLNVLSAEWNLIRGTDLRSALRRHQIEHELMGE